MKFPIIVKQKKVDGEKCFEAFCPVFDDAETFSPCDSMRDAIDEVAEIVQDDVDDLLEEGKNLPQIPSKQELEKKYPDAKVFWVNIEEDETSGDETLFGDDEQDEGDDDEDDFEEGSDDEEPEDEEVDYLELYEILDDDDDE